MNEYTATSEEMKVVDKLKKFTEKTREQEKINSEIAHHVFSKIAEYIQGQLPNDWECTQGTARYEGKDEEKEETEQKKYIWFNPKDWPDGDIAWYELGYYSNEEVGEHTYLEIAMNCAENCSLSFDFRINLTYFEDTLPQAREIITKILENKELRTLEEQGVLTFASADEIEDDEYPWIFTIPFKLDSQSVIDNYPDLDKSLAPIDKALEAIFRSYELIKDAVDELKEIAPEDEE